MFSRFHQKLGTAGFVVAVVALAAALAGTAFAAAGLNSTQKKEVKKIAKKFAGKRGPQGIAGPQGSPGVAGKEGAAGREGSRGPEGQRGPEGPAGPTETKLPAGETSKGLWSFSGKGVFGTLFTISFPLRVEPAPGEVHTHWIGKAEWLEAGQEYDTAACPGSASNPLAEPGELCIYAGEVVKAGQGNTRRPVGIGADTSDFEAGVVGEFEIASGEEGYGFGSWAVTAACPEDEPVC